MLDIGMNDIAKITDEHWKSKIKALVLTCKSIANQFDSGVTVCFLEVIPRVGFTRRNMTPAKFEERANYFNSLLSLEQGKALRQSPPSNFRYGKMQGWRNFSMGNRYYQRDYSEMLSRDGIHPTIKELRKRYASSVKKAILLPRNFPGRI